LKMWRMPTSSSSLDVEDEEVGIRHIFNLAS